MKRFKSFAGSLPSLFKHSAFSILFLTFALVGSALTSNAALDLSTVTLDVSPVFTLAGIIISAIASIWAIKKVIKLANRS